MSINAISSVSLYEYYYQINKENEEKKSSPLAKQMEKYGLTPTDNEALNAALLQRAIRLEQAQQEEESSVSYADRPWADIMYQLNLSFNDDPKDDIEDIKDELANLVVGIDDEQLGQEIADLESYAERLYISYTSNNTTSLSQSTLTSELNNLSVINMAGLL